MRKEILVTLQAGESLSEAFGELNMVPVQFILDSTWTTAPISFVGSHGDENDYATVTVPGTTTEYSIAGVAASAAFSPDVAALLPWNFLKLRSGTASAAQVQAAAHTIRVILAPQSEVVSVLETVNGTTADAAIVTDANGTVSGKLRGLVKILADVWDSVSHFLKVQLQAGTAVIGKVSTPSFDKTDSITRPANATPYAANQSINCDLTVTAGSYVAETKTVTLTSAGHSLQVGDRITVTGIDAGFTWTNVNGNWIVTAKDTDTFSFVTTNTPTGVTPAAASVTHAVAKMMSLEVASVAGSSVIVERFTLNLQGVQMTGQVRLWVYNAQKTVLYDQAAFPLLNANKTGRAAYYDLYPVTGGTGSDCTFAFNEKVVQFKCAAGDTRLYFRLQSVGAGTPVSGGVISLNAVGFELLG